VSNIGELETASTTGLPEHPLCVAVLLCESIITEEGSRNRTLVRAFDHMGALAVPTTHPRLTLFCSLTGGTGEPEITVEVLSPERERLFVLTTTVRFESPLDFRYVEASMQDFPLPDEGIYQFRIFSGERQIGFRHMVVGVSTGPRVEEDDDGGDKE
jgi:hypothetical protein